MTRNVLPILLILLAQLSARAQAPTPPFPADLVRWTRDPAAPVFAGTGDSSWDRKIRERGWITIEDGTYHLFYTGYNDDRSPNRSLGHATSPDGLTWTRDPANPLFDLGWVEDMCVLKHDGVYYMFAEGKDDIAHLLTSTNLKHWTERGPLDIRKVDGTPIAPGARGTPFVLIEGGTWHLFYERNDLGVWLATSKDGRVWTNVQDDPVLPMGPDPYDRYAVAVNQVFKRDGYYYAIYHANAHKPWKDWSTCLARSKDLVHWEKYPGNPIVADNRSSGILVRGSDGAHLYTMHPEVVRFSTPKPVPVPAAAQR